MKLKIEFVIAKTNEHVVLECEANVSDNFICFQNNNDTYAYIFGTTKIWKMKNNVIVPKKLSLQH